MTPDPAPDKKVALDQLMSEHGLSGDTILYRATLPEFLSTDKATDTLRVTANDDSPEAVIDVYGDGHIWGAHQIGPGLAFTETQDNEWLAEDRKNVCARLQDVLDQGGLVYPVESVITDKAWYVTLPSGTLSVRSA
jgi:hypothetical protein